MGANARENQCSCAKCKKTFTTKAGHVFHMRNHTEEKLLRCAVCKKSFSRKCILNIHMKTHTRERPFRCAVCGKSFINIGSLDIHMRTHTGERPFRCTVCERLFSQKGNLNYHMRTHTGERPFRCAVCEKSFSQKCNLDSHMITHTKERSFKCAVCEKSFSRKCNLDSHMITHTKERSFKCAICEKSYVYQSSRDFHMRTHTGERSFRCALCEKSFVHKGDLDTHMRTHTEERPFRCAVCKKSFSHKGNLDTHMRTHTGERPFRCAVCEKSYAQKGLLDTHLRTHSSKKLYRRIECESFGEDSCAEDQSHQNERTHYERNDEAYFHCSVTGKGEIPPKSSASVFPIKTLKLNCINNNEMSQAKSLEPIGPEIMKEKNDSLSIPVSDSTEAVEETWHIVSVESLVDDYQLLCLECGEKFRNADDYKSHSCYNDLLCSVATSEDEYIHEDNVKDELDDDTHGTQSVCNENIIGQTDNLNHDEHFIESCDQDFDLESVTQESPLTTQSHKVSTYLKSNHSTRTVPGKDCEYSKDAFYAYIEYLVVTDWLSKS